VGVPQPERVRRDRVLHLRRVLDRLVPSTAFANHDIAWILLSFAIFNTYMLLMSAQLNAAVFGVFLTLELTEIIVALGNFTNSPGTVQFGGYVGIVTALVAWYTSAAGVSNGLAGRIRLPVGKPLLS
jgi:uncharacterized protein